MQYFKKPEKNITQYLGRCPFCQAKFGDNDALVILKENESTLLHVDCKFCKSSVILNVIEKRGDYITTVGIMSDLIKDDILRFKNKPEISYEEVIELHKFLKTKTI